MAVSSIKDARVANAFSAYPEAVRVKLLFLRSLILEAADEMGKSQELEETLKWGEPGYLVPSGSTVRIGWNNSRPQQYAMYFNCQTKLVDTFRELFADRFSFEGNRAIVFDVNEDVPVAELKQCISLCLNYHRLKHLPLLGV